MPLRLLLLLFFTGIQMLIVIGRKRKGKWREAEREKGRKGEGGKGEERTEDKIES